MKLLDIFVLGLWAVSSTVAFPVVQATEEVERSAGLSVSSRDNPTCHAHFVWKYQCRDANDKPDYIVVMTELYYKDGGKDMVGNYDKVRKHHTPPSVALWPRNIFAHINEILMH